MQNRPALVNCSPAPGSTRRDGWGKNVRRGAAIAETLRPWGALPAPASLTARTRWERRRRDCRGGQRAPSAARPALLDHGPAGGTRDAGGPGSSQRTRPPWSGYLHTGHTRFAWRRCWTVDRAAGACSETGLAVGSSHPARQRALRDRLVPSPYRVSPRCGLRPGHADPRSSPARNHSASRSASRRSVLPRSPGVWVSTPAPRPCRPSPRRLAGPPPAACSEWSPAGAPALGRGPQRPPLCSVSTYPTPQTACDGPWAGSFCMCLCLCAPTLGVTHVSRTVDRLHSSSQPRSC